VPEAASLAAHEGAVTAVAFALDGKRLATAGADRLVKLWSAGGSRPVTLEGFVRPVVRLLFSPDGKRLVTVGKHAEQGEAAVEVKIWDAASGKELAAVPGLAGGPVSAAFGPDGNRVLLACPGKTLKIVDAATGKEASRLDEVPGAPQAGTAVDYLAGTPDGSRLALAWRDSITLLTRPLGGDWEKRDLTEHKQPVAGLAWGAGGTILAVDLGATRVRVWNLKTFQSPGVWFGPHVEARSVGFSPDGTRLLTSTGTTTVSVWDLGTRRWLLALRGPTAPATGMAFSPDGSRVASGSLNGTVVIWDASSRRVIAGP
jgi:WD40 repeat protein